MEDMSSLEHLIIPVRLSRAFFYFCGVKDVAVVSDWIPELF
jgi:hypothetical protein